MKKMQPEEIIDFATHAKKGVIHTFYYHKQVKLANKYEGYTLETRSRFQGMFGDYDNRKAVIEKRENGQAKGTCALSEVVKDLLYRNAKGEMFLRVLPIDSGNASKQYILNGEEVSLEVIASIFPKSYYESHGCPDCMSLRLENIEAIA